MNSHDEKWDWLPGPVVPFDWQAFVDKHRILYRDHGGVRAVAGALAFRLSLYAIGQAAWGFDDLLYPDWRRTRLRGPIFILGHQRSGTTFLHRLLASDKAHARSLLFHEMLLPASSFQRMLDEFGTVDAKLGGKLRDGFARWQEKKFSPLDHIHRLRFDEVEEDEFVLWTIFASAMCVNDAPISTADSQLDDLRYFHQWPEKRQARALGWYRACLLKKVHREPSSDSHLPWAVSKNPAFSQKITLLRKVFPDARFIYLVRNPLEAIPSRLSLIRSIWNARFPEFEAMNENQVRTILADSLNTYLYAERDLPGVPDEQKLVVPYEWITADARGVVEEIYRRFELPGPDESLSERLRSLKKRDGKFKSQHDYSLAEFFLTESDIREPLAEVFSRYQFDRAT